MGPANEGLPHPVTISTLCPYVDVAHTNYIRTRQSIGDFVVCLAGAAVAYEQNGSRLSAASR
jgi:hypothetical protein